MNPFRVYGVTCVLILAGFAARATTIVLPTDEQLVTKSPVIVSGTVLSSNPVERDGAVVTETVVSVDRAIKGNVAGTITVTEIGGETADRITKIFGAPEFTAGEQVLLFLDRAPHGGYRTMDLYVGKLTQRKTDDGRRIWMRDDSAPDVTLLDADFKPIQSKNVQRDAAKFEEFVSDRVAGRPGSRNYGIENPVLARDVVGNSTGSGSITSNFTLISDPTIYRWFRFDSGKAADWYSSGTQPGYVDGGVSELRTAMAAWTGYSSAKIYYNYIGSRSGSMGGLNAANGVNEVLFNDPLNEISGSWDPSTGGVVGTGGFNGVSSRQSWTAPFAADATHPAGTFSAWNITEGNLTIQDGVSPGQRLTSARLAEIIAHEFGHTLGFGHSADSTALMYYSVTGLGPSLRADDQLAARWLYPNSGGTQPPPVPVTPTVSASFDMSTTSATAGASVAFTDRSSGSPTSWSWSFGDGATSSAQSPTHAFAGPGTYNVTLTASNSTSSSVATRSINVVSTAAYRTLVSVVAQTSGVGGTSWRTELNVLNAGTQGASVTFIFIPTAGGNVVTRSVFLSSKQSITYGNALLDLFGIGNGAGALAIEATSAGASADLRITSRTFTTGAFGTYGQSVPDVQSSDLQKTLYMTGIRSSAAFRTNVGLVNRAAAPVSATLTLYNASGSAIGSKSISLPANSFQQSPLSSFFPGVDGASYDALSMRLTAASQDAVSAYASVVDNATQDPIYIQASPAATGGTLTVPVVGRAAGANGTFWRSDVTIYNPSSSSIQMTLRYNGAARTINLGAGDTTVMADVLSQFGQSSGSGTLQFSWSSYAGPVVTSRTYTTVSTGGTYGQSIDPVEQFASRMYVPGLRNDGTYRSNAGFVNGGSTTATFTVVALAPGGYELARQTLSLAPNTQAQYSTASLFPSLSTSNGFTLYVEGASTARLFAYGSIVDNQSGDPVFFAGR